MSTKAIKKESPEEQLERKIIQAKQEGKDVKIEKLDDLPHIPGELDVRDLSDGDKFQLLIRYLNNISLYLKNSMLGINSLDIAVHILGKAMGVDIEKLKEKAQAEALEGILNSQPKQPKTKQKNYKN